MATVEDELNGLLPGQEPQNKAGNPNIYWGIDLDKDENIIEGEAAAVKLEIPKYEDTKTETCWSKCRTEDAKGRKVCTVIRQRVAEWMKKNGCPSVIRAQKTRKRSCAPKKKACATKKKAPVKRKTCSSTGCSR